MLFILEIMASYEFSGIYVIYCIVRSGVNVTLLW